MKGCRPLKPEEVSIVMDKLGNMRDKVLVILGISTGFRISELLSLKVKDVYHNGKPLNRATVAKQNTKGKIESRSVAINSRVQEYIALLVKEESLTEDMYLFGSRKGGAIDRKHAWRILKEAFELSGLTGKLATHTLRKTMAHNVYKASGKDIIKTQRALGHKSLNSTTAYLSADQEDIDSVMIGIDAFKAS